MNWRQIIDTFNNIGLSALVAVAPILFIFWTLLVKKMTDLSSTGFLEYAHPVWGQSFAFKGSQAFPAWPRYL